MENILYEYTTSAVKTCLRSIREYIELNQNRNMMDGYTTYIDDSFLGKKFINAMLEYPTENGDFSYIHITVVNKIAIVQDCYMKNYQLIPQNIICQIDNDITIEKFQLLKNGLELDNYWRYIISLRSERRGEFEFFLKDNYYVHVDLYFQPE